jgi:ABC-type phosphate/phosphonate transport system substrate-binding protein
VRGKSGPERLRVLAASAPFPHLPWAVSADMPEALKQRVQSLLLDLVKTAEGRRVLESAELTRLNPASDADYAPHRAIVRRVFDESE